MYRWILTLMGASLLGCSPHVKVEAPDKPITINLNVNVKHELRVKIANDVKDTIHKNPDLF